MEDVVTRFRQGIPGLVPDAWIIASAKGHSTAPVVAVHGITRNVEEMVEALTPRASITGRTVVIPHFPRSHFQRYQLAHCKQRADLALLHLLKDLRKERMIADGPFDLSGFSGGAQFAHRFAWLYPQAVGHLCITAPGWWTFPDSQVSWPYGMGHEPTHSGKNAQRFRLTSNLRRFLDRQITVCVGGEDTEHDANLRRGTEIDRQQGRNRVQRARKWCDAAKSAAHAQGVSPKVSFKLLPGCGHSFADCVEKGRLDEVFVPQTSHAPFFRQASQNREISTLQFMKRTAA